MRSSSALLLLALLLAGGELPSVRSTDSPPPVHADPQREAERRANLEYALKRLESTRERFPYDRARTDLHSNNVLARLDAHTEARKAAVDRAVGALGAVARPNSELARIHGVIAENTRALSDSKIRHDNTVTQLDRLRLNVERARPPGPVDRILSLAQRRKEPSPTSPSAQAGGSRAPIVLSGAPSKPSPTRSLLGRFLSLPSSSSSRPPSVTLGSRPQRRFLSRFWSEGSRWNRPQSITSLGSRLRYPAGGPESEGYVRLAPESPPNEPFKGLTERPGQEPSSSRDPLQRLWPKFKPKWMPPVPAMGSGAGRKVPKERIVRDLSAAKSAAAIDADWTIKRYDSHQLQALDLARHAVHRELSALRRKEYPGGAAGASSSASSSAEGGYTKSQLER